MNFYLGRQTINKKLNIYSCIMAWILACSISRSRYGVKAFSVIDYVRYLTMKPRAANEHSWAKSFVDEQEERDEWSGHHRHQKMQLSAQRSPQGRDGFYSIEEAFRRAELDERAYPPGLDSQNEEDGFGANTYDGTLDMYDLEHERQQNPLAENRKDDETVRKSVSFGEITAAEQSIDAYDVSSYRPVEITTSSIRSGTPKPTASLHLANVPAYQLDPFYSLSVDELAEKLIQVEKSIYEQHGEKFNINAPKQVSKALFGSTDGSTSKDRLEGMAGAGNRLASLILEYRKTKNRIRRLERRQESEEKGTQVLDASTLARIDDSNVQADGVEDTEKPFEAVKMRSEMADPLILVDASAYIFRAYYSMPEIHRKDGMPTGAVMGFCNMLNSMFLDRMMKGEQPRLVLCFDAKGDTFRHALFESYKATRKNVPMDLVPQFDLIRQAAEAYGIRQIEAQNYEADDVIATLATMAVSEGIDVNILSGDKDLMQLVTDIDKTPQVQMIDPIKKDRTTHAQVIEKWGVTPDKLGDLLALAGDSSDNIPGVKGIGPKTAAKLINQFGSLETLWENLDNISQASLRSKLSGHRDNAELSRKLVELNRTLPIDTITGFPEGFQSVEKLRVEPLDTDRILAFYDEMGFRALRRQLETRIDGLKRSRIPSNKNKRPKATIPKPEDFSEVPF